MAFDRRLLMCLLLLLLFRNLSSSSAVPTSRSFETFKDEVSRFGDFQQAVMEDVGIFQGLVEKRRMDIELMDYPETGANNNHDPKPPGRV